MSECLCLIVDIPYTLSLCSSCIMNSMYVKFYFVCELYSCVYHHPYPVPVYFKFTRNRLFTLQAATYDVFVCHLNNPKQGRMCVSDHTIKKVVKEKMHARTVKIYTQTYKRMYTVLNTNHYSCTTKNVYLPASESVMPPTINTTITMAFIFNTNSNRFVSLHA